MGAIDFLQNLKRKKKEKGMRFPVSDSVEFKDGKPSLKQRDVQVFPKLEKAFVKESREKMRPAKKSELGGLVRRRPDQQDVINESLYQVQKPKKPQPRLI